MDYFVQVPVYDEFAGIPRGFLGLGASKKKLKKKLKAAQAEAAAQAAAAAAAAAEAAKAAKKVKRQARKIVKKDETIAELKQVAQTLVEQGMSTQQAAQTVAAAYPPAMAAQGVDPYAGYPTAYPTAYPPAMAAQGVDPYTGYPTAYPPAAAPVSYQYAPAYQAPVTLLPSDMPVYAEETQPFSVPSQVTDLQADPFSSAASWGGGFFGPGRRRGGQFMRQRFVRARGGAACFTAPRF